VIKLVTHQIKKKIIKGSLLGNPTAHIEYSTAASFRIWRD